MKDRIIELRKSGLAPFEIAERLGLTRGQVAGVLFRAGLTKPPAQPSKPKPVKPMPILKEPEHVERELEDIDQRTLSDPTQSAWRAHVRRRVKDHDWER